MTAAAERMASPPAGPGNGEAGPSGTMPVGFNALIE
jgi:hypothetical protein